MGSMCSCEATWTGLRTAHCSVCHETFAGVGLFDTHRVNGECKIPKDFKFFDNVWNGAHADAGKRQLRKDLAKAGRARAQEDATAA